MPLVAWMYDVAREQSPTSALLDDLCRRSAASGYNAIGLYLEHRFAYASAPWAAGPGCLTPDMVRTFAANCKATGLRLIPFLNTLGHMEGFVRSEGGQHLSEGPLAGALGMQICPTRPQSIAFARGLVHDVLAAFDDEWIHLGGDETRQLGQCPRCAERVAQIGKAGLYSEYYASLCRWVLEQGRRPCLWGDMLIEHPEALAALPRQTLIFDWQYFTRPGDSTRLFRERGFDVVCCPSLQTYNAGWCYLPESLRNIDEHAADARELGALGVCVTTWELAFFTNYLALLPLIFAAGRRLAHGNEWTAAMEAEGGPGFAAAADILGRSIPEAASFLQPGTWRHLRDRFVIRQNPLYLWEEWRGEACGGSGDEILRLCDDADALLPESSPLRFANELHRVAVLFVRLIEAARSEYAARRWPLLSQRLSAARAVLARLRPGLEQAAQSGGSSADLARLELMTYKVWRVERRVEDLIAQAIKRGTTVHLPAFETLLHDGYCPDDQAAWRTNAYL